MKKTNKAVLALLPLVFTACGCSHQPAILESDKSSVVLTEETQKNETEHESMKTVPEKPSLIERDVEVNGSVSDEYEAEVLLREHLLIEDPAISFRYSGSNKNDFDTWYDFVEFYNGVPIWGCSSRVHAFQSEMVLIQGRAVASGFEAFSESIGEQQALYNYKPDAVNDGYVYVETCYLYISGNNTIPLCHHYSNGTFDVFLSAVTGELVSEKSNIIID